MTTAEFMDVQRLSVDELRTRFRLAPSCQPSLTALSTDPMINQVAAAIGYPAELRVPPPRRGRGQRRGSPLPRQTEQARPAAPTGRPPLRVLLPRRRSL